MNLVFDCETSGLTREGLPWNDESQPHLLQLGAKLVTDKGDLIAQASAIFKPDGWSVEPEAERVHGISEMRAHRYGRNPVPFLATFQEMTRGAHRVIAHNFEFDWKVVALAISRAGGSPFWWHAVRKISACSMELSTPIVKLPNPKNPREFKWPKLEEAHDHFYPAQAPYQNRHDAVTDLDACWNIFKAIQGAS